jgi:hypothetical protein
MKKWFRRLAYFALFIFLFINIVAAFHAYKFTHFYDKHSASTQNPEQMSAWEKTKVILTGVDYVKKDILEVPSFPYKDVTLHTSDELALKAWR